MQQSNLSELPSLVTSITERYNFIVQLSQNIESEVRLRDGHVDEFAKSFTSDFEELKILVDELKSSVEKAEAERKLVAGQFKLIVKRDSLDKLNRRIEDLPYEEAITRRELEKYGL